MLRVEIERSWWLAGLLSVVHLAAFALIMTLVLPLWGIAFAALILSASAAHGIFLHALQRLPRSITGLEISDNCKLMVRNAGGVWQEAALLRSSFATPYLTIVNFRHPDERRTRSLVILSDRVQPDLFRRLRVLLRWRCGKGGAEDPAVY
jgi:toxin CptA